MNARTFQLLISAALLISPTAAMAQTYTILHNFGDGSALNLNGATAADGNYPAGYIIQANDLNFYGTTSAGGTTGNGTVFKMTPTGQVTILHSFGDGTATNTDGTTNDGFSPRAGLLQASDNKLYGTTYEGGNQLDPVNNSLGCVYRIGLDGSSPTVIHDFRDYTQSDGFFPEAGLIQAKNGLLYGTTSYSTGGDGSIFDMSPLGVDDFIAHNFGYKAPANDGNESTGDSGVIQGADGNFYGTTTAGGLAGYGVIFQMTANNFVTTLHSFGSGSVAHDGLSPNTGLTQGKDGAFYGTTLAGGAVGGGTIFKVVVNKNVGITTILHSFGSGTVLDPNGNVTPEGRIPCAKLVQAGDGNFYGATTSLINTPATLFRMTPLGAITILHYFDNVTVPADGEGYPGVALGKDGALYGMVQSGGSKNLGIIFKLALTPPLPQTINFPTIPTHASTDAPFNLGAAASSGLPITYSVVSGPASVSGNTVYLAGTAGPVVIAATQAGGFAPVINGSVFYAPVVHQQSFLVKYNQTITFPAVGPVTVGQTVALNATASSGLPITYKILPTAGYTGTATISGSSITFTGAGHINLAATQAGNATYLAAPQKSQTVTPH